MGVNWFEGGRRITLFIQWFVGLACVAYILFSSNPKDVTLVSTLPSEKFIYTGAQCEYGDHKENWGIMLFPDGKRRPLTLCFAGNSNFDGDIVFREGVADEDYPDRNIKKGEQVFWAASPYSTEVQEYAAARAKTEVFRKRVLEEAANQFWMQSWKAMWARLKECLPILGFGIFGLWIFSGVLGWIVRGFFGVPSGSDFRHNQTR